MKKALALGLLTLLLAGSALMTGMAAEENPTVEEMVAFAIQDEVNAEAAYQAILDAYGAQARPFTNIVKAEKTHQALLLPLMETYGIPLPEARGIAVPSTFPEALQLGVKAEEENIAIYQGFLSQGGLPEEVRAVFERLMAASQNHLAAFSRASQGGTGRGQNQAGPLNHGRGRWNQGTRAPAAPGAAPGFPGRRHPGNP